MKVDWCVDVPIGVIVVVVLGTNCAVEALPGTFSIGQSNRDDANQTTVTTAATAAATNATTAHNNHHPRQGQNRNMGNHSFSHRNDDAASGFRVFVIVVGFKGVGCWW